MAYLGDPNKIAEQLMKETFDKRMSDYHKALIARNFAEFLLKLGIKSVAKFTTWQPYDAQVSS